MLWKVLLNYYRWLPLNFCLSFQKVQRVLINKTSEGIPALGSFSTDENHFCTLLSLISPIFNFTWKNCIIKNSKSFGFPKIPKNIITLAMRVEWAQQGHYGRRESFNFIFFYDSFRTRSSFFLLRKISSLLILSSKNPNVAFFSEDTL